SSPSKTPNPPKSRGPPDSCAEPEKAKWLRSEEKVFGSEIPYGNVWAPGGKPITMFTNTPVAIGGENLSIGAYTLVRNSGRRSMDPHCLQEYRYQRKIRQAPGCGQNSDGVRRTPESGTAVQRLLRARLQRRMQHATRSSQLPCLGCGETGIAVDASASASSFGGPQPRPRDSRNIFSDSRHNFPV